MSQVKRFMPFVVPTRAGAPPKNPPPSPSAGGVIGLGVPVNVRSAIALRVEELDFHRVGVLVEEVIKRDVAIAAAHRVVGLEQEQRIAGELGVAWRSTPMLSST